MKKHEKIYSCEISEGFSVFWLHTKNPERFPGFAVVVILFFDEILDDFHVFSECVFFQKKINNPFEILTVFPRKSDNFYWT